MDGSISELFNPRHDVTKEGFQKRRQGMKLQADSTGGLQQLRHTILLRTDLQSIHQIGTDSLRCRLTHRLILGTICVNTTPKQTSQATQHRRPDTIRIINFEIRPTTLQRELLLLKVLHQDDELDVRIQVIISRLVKRGHGVCHNCKRPRGDFRFKFGKNRFNTVKIFCIIEGAVASIINRNYQNMSSIQIRPYHDAPRSVTSRICLMAPGRALAGDLLISALERI